MDRDIRWIQRLDNYKKALVKLSEAVSLYESNVSHSRGILDLIKEGLIQRFEYTQELAWNVMKDYELYQGETDIHGSRDAIRKALAIGIISDSRWMNTIVDRNSTSHNYDEDTTNAIVQNILDVYVGLFREFADKMCDLAEKKCLEYLAEKNVWNK